MKPFFGSGFVSVSANKTRKDKVSVDGWRCLSTFLKDFCCLDFGFLLPFKACLVIEKMKFMKLGSKPDTFQTDGKCIR